MYRFLLPFLTAALLAGCASQPERPDWVDGTPNAYPADRWFVGHGTGTSAAAAERHARAALARNLEVLVQETTEDAVRYQQHGDAPGELTRELARHSTARTEVLLEGARIAERWRAAEGGDHHALALLDRVATADRLRHAIEQQDRIVRAALERARGADEPLRQLAAADEALKAQQERERLDVRLTVVDPSGIGAPTRLSSADLATDYSRLLSRLRIVPIGAGTADHMAGAALAEAGFAASGGEPDYQLATRLEGQPLQRDGWHWMRGELTITLLYEGRAVGEQRWPLRSAAQDPATAEVRFRQEAAELLRRELRAVILGFGARQ